MRTSSRLPRLSIAVITSWTLLVGVSAVLAQSPSLQTFSAPTDVSDDMLTIVVGTRFVASSAADKSARAQFNDERIPLSAFNETDHCVDQRALELAQEYFNTLGPVLGKAGHYYFVADDEISKSVAACEKLHGRPPQAWVSDKTKVIAFGRVVATEDAPALEKSLR
ncbi:hypothetical protein [Hyphomicrobium sp.]|uniref:hypothetical protein n=1 Tax=Hyphomicrobium sp. TaxID=82 RepID=UPI003F6FFA0D